MVIGPCELLMSTVTLPVVGTLVAGGLTARAADPPAGNEQVPGVGRVVAPVLAVAPVGDATVGLSAVDFLPPVVTASDDGHDRDDGDRAPRSTRSG